jgi:hypothetical protein
MPTPARSGATVVNRSDREVAAVLRAEMAVLVVVMGANFRFGSGGRGGVLTVRELRRRPASTESRSQRWRWRARRGLLDGRGGGSGRAGAPLPRGVRRVVPVGRRGGSGSRAGGGRPMRGRPSSPHGASPWGPAPLRWSRSHRVREAALNSPRRQGGDLRFRRRVERLLAENDAAALGALRRGIHLRPPS